MLPTPKMAMSILILNTHNLIFTCENAWSYLQIHHTTVRIHGHLSRSGSRATIAGACSRPGSWRRPCKASQHDPSILTRCWPPVLWSAAYALRMAACAMLAV